MRGRYCCLDILTAGQQLRCGGERTKEYNHALERKEKDHLEDLRRRARPVMDAPLFTVRCSEFSNFQLGRREIKPGDTGRHFFLVFRYPVNIRAVGARLERAFEGFNGGPE